MPSLPAAAWMIFDEPYAGEDPAWNPHTEGSDVLWDTDSGHGFHRIPGTDVQNVDDPETGARYLVGYFGRQHFRFIDVPTCSDSDLLRITGKLGLPDGTSREVVSDAIRERVSGHF